MAQPVFEIDVRLDVKELTKSLNDLQRKQIPFATAQALTRTAQDVQKAEVVNVQRVFENKKKWWLKQQPTGIKITPAKKNNLVASIFTNAFFADLQEEGGTKRPFRGSTLAIPTDNVAKRFRKSGGARDILNQKNVFITKFRDGSKGIVKKVGGKRNPRLKALFGFERTAKIPRRFNFKKVAARVANRQFIRRFNQSLDKALKTARFK